MKFFSDDYRDALLYLNYAIDNHIFIADSFYYRSLAKYNMGEMLSALLDIEKSIAWVPNNESFVRTRGSFNLSLRDFSNAVVDFSVAVSIDLTILFSILGEEWPICIRGSIFRPMKTSRNLSN